MSLATDIQDACLALPLLDFQSRRRLIERILKELEESRRSVMRGVPPEERTGMDTLVSSVAASVNEIASMETRELLDVLTEFEKLLEVLAGIGVSPTRH